MKSYSFKSYGFALGLAIWLGATLVAAAWIGNEYYFYAIIAVLQLMAISTAWNIVGGFCGYINFGTTAFVALGAYTGSIIGQFLGLSLVFQLLAAAVVAGCLGLLTGYMTLRLKGIFFAIATFAIAVILETVINNVDAIGGARGMAISRPNTALFFSSYARYLFFIMTIIVMIGIAVARYIQRSWIGRGLRAIRDNEEAAECVGVPTLSLKLLAATLSGALMGVTGAITPVLTNYIEPTSLFGIETGVLAIAAPLIGGTSHWVGPLIGAILLGAMSQVLSVTISSEVNALLVGVFLVLAVTLAPKGLLGFVEAFWPRKSRTKVGSQVQHERHAN